MDVKFKLIEKANIEIILPLLNELDPSIPEEVLSLRLSEMVKSGYECIGIFNERKIIGICGIWTLVKYYIGKHIEPDNVYIRANYRGLGVGRKLDSWLKNLAVSRGCKVIELNCYIKNKKGNEFWEANGYKAIGMHYQKKLES